MTTQNTFLLILFAGIFLLLLSCGKEVDQFIPDPINLDFEQEFGNPVTPHTFLVDGTRDTILFTPRGAEFEIYQKSFAFENGELCPCEKMEFQITEYTRASDFILDPNIVGTPPDHIAVEGLYQIKAENDGKQIDLKPGAELHYHVPTDFNLEFGLLYAFGPVEDPSWKSADQFPNRTGKVEFSTDIDGYEVFVDQLGWSGIGKDLSSLGTTHVCVDLDLLTHDKNAEVYAVGTSKLLVKQFYFDVAKECFCGELPLQIDVDLVVIRKSADDEYQFAKESTTVTKDLELHMTYQPGTKEKVEITDLIKKL